MNLLSVRIITANFNEVVEFYEQITEMSAVRYTPRICRIKNGNGNIGHWQHQNIRGIWWK